MSERLEQIGREITALVTKLDKVGGIDYRDSINQLLEEAAGLCDNESAFESFKEAHCPNLKQSRTYELLSIEQGRKTVEEVRDATRRRVAKHRASKKEAVTESDSVTSNSASLALAIQKQADDVVAKLPASWDTAEESAERRKAEYAAADDVETKADDYPERTVTKSELMAALGVILSCKFVPRDEYSSNIADITDPDIELCDALSEAEEIIGYLRSQTEFNDAVGKALQERRQAKEADEKAQNEAAKKRAREIAPQIKERAAKLGYELTKIRGTIFYLKGKGDDHHSIHVDRIDDRLERLEREKAEAAADIEAAA